MRMEDGRLYEGRFNKDLFDGYGVMVYPDGSSYEGEWNMGVKHGKGLMKVRNEVLLEKFDVVGAWENGKLVVVES